MHSSRFSGLESSSADLSFDSSVLFLSSSGSFAIEAL
jgi:hypothetical protein